MSQQIKDLFKTHLLQEEDDVFRDRSLPEPEEDSFEQGLDTGTNPSDFDVDGLGFDVEKVHQDNFAQVYKKVDRIEEMIKELIDPKVDGNLTKLLSSHDRADSVGNGVIQKLEKPIQKASIALSEIKIILDQIASMEPTLQKRVDASNSQ